MICSAGDPSVILAFIQTFRSGVVRIEREAAALPLDHAFGFQLADVGPAAIEMQRQCRRADGRGLSGSRSRDRLGARRSRSLASFLLRGRRIAHFRFRGHSWPCRTCRWPTPRDDPNLTLA
jgi:hypothetical protein